MLATVYSWGSPYKIPECCHTIPAQHFQDLSECVLFQTSGCSATAKGLKPGHLYQFEVSAINKEGQSEPIFTGDPILAENPYSEPR